MIKKFFSCVGVLSLICFSFYYTDSAVEIVKRNDPIMQKIVSVSSNYELEAVDAILVDNNIIPGISGTKVDVDRSYEKMKKYGDFNSGLLVFEEVLPTVNVTNNYDKFIVKGNNIKQSISLIFKLDDTIYIDDLLSILDKKDTKVTFFINKDIIINDIDILEKIYLNGHSIELLSNDYDSSEIKKVNKVIDNLTKSKIKYCYSEVENVNVLNNCKKNKMYSIIPNIITSSLPYSNIKNQVTSGSIISLDNNINTIRELSSIINYLNQKGYKIIILEELLDE